MAGWRYETDRAFTGPADLGLDRFIVSGSGPIVAGIQGVFGIDLNARTDFDPTSAPAPTDPEDPRYSIPAPLPHNAGQQLSYAGKLVIPAGPGNTIRLFGLYGSQQQTLYDQLYKYDLEYAPGLSFSGTLLSASFQHTSSPTAKLPMVIDARLGYFDRSFVRGMLADSVEYFFGAFTTSPFNIVGEDIARARDTIAAQQPIPGLYLPDYSSRSPWGVPAFFQSQGSRGSLDWNDFRETGPRWMRPSASGHAATSIFGGEYVSQRVQTFQRVLGLPPGGRQRAAGDGIGLLADVGGALRGGPVQASRNWASPPGSATTSSTRSRSSRGCRPRSSDRSIRGSPPPRCSRASLSSAASATSARRPITSTS